VIRGLTALIDFDYHAPWIVFFECIFVLQLGFNNGWFILIDFLTNISLTKRRI